MTFAKALQGIHSLNPAAQHLVISLPGGDLLFSCSFRYGSAVESEWHTSHHEAGFGETEIGEQETSKTQCFGWVLLLTHLVTSGKPVSRWAGLSGDQRGDEVAGGETWM